MFIFENYFNVGYFRCPSQTCDPLLGTRENPCSRHVFFLPYFYKRFFPDLISTVVLQKSLIACFLISNNLKHKKVLLIRLYFFVNFIVAKHLSFLSSFFTSDENRMVFERFVSIDSKIILKQDVGSHFDGGFGCFSRWRKTPISAPANSGSESFSN